MLSPVMTRNVVIALAVVVAAAVAIAAWYDDPGADRTAAEAALIAELAEDLGTVEPGDPPIALGPDDARCVAEHVVDAVGAERLEELGVDAATVNDRGFEPARIAFLDEERTQVVDAFDACVDLTLLAVDSMAHGRGQAARSCVEQAMAGPIARELWVWRVGPATAEVPAVLVEPLERVDECLR